MFHCDFVIDTVRAKVDWPLINDDYLEREYWSITRKSKDSEVAWEEETQAVEDSFFAKHEILEIRAFGDAHRIHTVEAELPKLIHGCNSELIRSQEQIEEALENLLNSFAGFADTGNGIYDFRGVDMSVHFVCDSPAAVVHAHRNCRYPRTKGEKRREFNASSASWDYCGRRFALYDKGRQLNARYCGRHVETASNFLRVEVQLRGKALKHAFESGDNFPFVLDFDECYQVFRSELLRFAPAREKAPSPRSKEEALAMLDQLGTEVDGRTASELFTEHMSAQTRRKWLRNAAEFHVAGVGFDWAEILPEDEPPALIDAE